LAPQGRCLLAELLHPTEQLRRIDVVPASDVRDHHIIREGFGDNRDLRLVRPLSPTLRPVQDLDAAQSDWLRDVIDVIINVSIRAHGAPGSHQHRRTTTCDQRTAYGRNAAYGS